MPTYRVGLQSANTARLASSRRIPRLVMQLILVDLGCWHHSRVKKTVFRGRSIIGTLFKVQLAFEMLKGRWQIILKRVDVHLKNVPNLVLTCLVLHNMCIIFGDVF